MKKISILCLEIGYGGIEKSIISLANLLCEKHKVEIACSYKLYEESVFKIDKRVKIKYLIDSYSKADKIKKQTQDKSHKKSTLLKKIKTIYLRRKTMINYIKNSDANVIISTKDIFDRWLGDYGKKDVIKIGWEHNHHHNNKRYALNVIKSCWNLDYLVLVSQDLKQFYKREMIKSKCRCVYIPNVIESIPHFLAKLTEKRLVSVGRLIPEKGYLDLLKIYSIISKDYPDWTLDIIGDGIEKPKIDRYIKDHNLKDKVTLHGFQNKDYIDKIFHNSSIYIMTSYTESFGIVLIEAMAHGIPCIAFSSAEGAREIIDSGKNGYLIKNRNHEAMIKKIEDLIKDYEIRQKIGKSARYSVKKYTSENVKEKWYNLIEKK